MVKVDLRAKVHALQWEIEFLQVFCLAVMFKLKLPGSLWDAWKTERERRYPGLLLSFHVAGGGVALGAPKGGC